MKKKSSPAGTTRKTTTVRKALAGSPARSGFSPPAIKTILVPIDFSGYARKALRYAVPMAHQYGATISLLYVIEPTVYPADLGFGQVVLPGIEDELRTKGIDELRNLIEEEIGNVVRAEAVVRTGKPHQEILKEAEEKNVDLIVIATHGHTGVEQILFGSTAMRVVRLAKCPVLTVRPGM